MILIFVNPIIISGKSIIDTYCKLSDHVCVCDRLSIGRPAVSAARCKLTPMPSKVNIM